MAAAEGICRSGIRGHRHQNNEYDLLCFCIMPNHVHQLVVNTPGDRPIYDTLGQLKSFTAKQANKRLGRSGHFWQSESFDHVVRAGKLQQTISYILKNPVAAGLVDHWRNWPYTWLNPRFDPADF